MFVAYWIGACVHACICVWIPNIVDTMSCKVLIQLFTKLTTFTDLGAVTVASDFGYEKVKVRGHNRRKYNGNGTHGGGTL